METAQVELRTTAWNPARLGVRMVEGNVSLFQPRGKYI
jgi:hypothetical protein